MIKIQDVGPDVVTRVGAVVSGSTLSGGFLAEVMSWNWGTISFVTATLCAIATFLWNAYYRRKTYQLQVEAIKRGAVFYELKE